jgi:sulfite reductase (NADPH) hemoprotein beta-component
VAADELFDPRPYCEIVRQWSTLAPEFLFLPRKFKIAISGGAEDRAAVRFHDIGAARGGGDGRLGFESSSAAASGARRWSAKLKDFLPRRSSSTTSRPSCGSTTATAGATTSTRRASRSW